MLLSFTVCYILYQGPFLFIDMVNFVVLMCSYRAERIAVCSVTCIPIDR